MCMTLLVFSQVRPKVGQAKASTYNLPKDTEHRFGAAMNMDKEGAREGKHGGGDKWIGFYVLDGSGPTVSSLFFQSFEWCMVHVYTFYIIFTNRWSVFIYIYIYIYIFVLGFHSCLKQLSTTGSSTHHTRLLALDVTLSAWTSQPPPTGVFLPSSSRTSARRTISVWKLEHCARPRTIPFALCPRVDTDGRTRGEYQFSAFFRIHSIPCFLICGSSFRIYSSHIWVRLSSRYHTY